MTYAQRVKWRIKTGLAVLTLSQPLLAADAVASPAASLVKTMFGLLVVLAVMAAIAWLVKRVGPVKQGGQSAIRIVGGVSVGSREKVIVVEVAGRWLVVGVAPGQVNSIANLDIVDSTAMNDEATEAASEHKLADVQTLGVQMLGAKGQAFAGWLRKAIEKPHAR